MTHSGFNPKTEVAIQKETKSTKKEGVGTFVRVIFQTVSLRGERLLPSLPWLPYVNPVSEFGSQVSPLLIFFSLLGFALNLFATERKLVYQEIGPGIEYANEFVRDVPWSIHVVKINRKRSDLKLITTLAEGEIFGLASLPEQINSVPPQIGQAVAGINGDFFLMATQPYQGDPRGLQIINGELVSAPGSEVCFWLEGSRPKIGKVISKFKVTWPDGTETPIGLNEGRSENETVLLTPTLGPSTRTTNGVELILERAGWQWLPLRAGKNYSVRVREIAGTNTPLAPDFLILSLGPGVLFPEVKTGMKLKISTATFPDLSKVQTAIGGGPMLVHDGEIPIRQPGAHMTAHAKERNPRTAFGWNDSNYFFVVVDGRRKNVSLGMSFRELAVEMAALGCKEAMNLDGGGSSTIWAGGKVLNQPSDNHDRSGANALICVVKIIRGKGHGRY